MVGRFTAWQLMTSGSLEANSGDVDDQLVDAFQVETSDRL